MNCIWILLLLCCCGNGGSCGNGNNVNANNGCGCGNNDCSCGCGCATPIQPRSCDCASNYDRAERIVVPPLRSDCGCNDGYDDRNYSRRVDDCDRRGRSCDTCGCEAGQ